MSNDPFKLARMAGYYKGVQSAGAAVSFGMDAVKVKLISTYLVSESKAESSRADRFPWRTPHLMAHASHFLPIGRSRTLEMPRHKLRCRACGPCRGARKGRVARCSFAKGSPHAHGRARRRTFRQRRRTLYRAILCQRYRSGKTCLEYLVIHVCSSPSVGGDLFRSVRRTCGKRIRLNEC